VGKNADKEIDWYAESQEGCKVSGYQGKQERRMARCARKKEEVKN
jgi:hypothetical protein